MYKGLSYLLLNESILTVNLDRLRRADTVELFWSLKIESQHVIHLGTMWSWKSVTLN